MNESNWRPLAYKIATQCGLGTPPSATSFSDAVANIEKYLRENFAPLVAEPAAPPESVEELASKLWDIYSQELNRQGFIEHTQPYADLSESFKEFDRVLARYVLKLLAEAKSQAVVETLEAAEHHAKEQFETALVDCGDWKEAFKCAMWAIRSSASAETRAALERMKAQVRIEALREAGIIILSRQADWTWSNVLARIDKRIAEEKAKTEPHG